MSTLRAVLATLLWAAAVASALIFTIAAVLIALRADPGIDAVRAVIRGADLLGMDAFSPYSGVFEFEGEWGRVKSGVANCALGALVYLCVGGALSRFVRPAKR